MDESQTERAQVISRFPLFLGLEEGDLSDIVRISRKKRLRKGEVLFTEGSLTNGFYLLIEGKFKLIRFSSKGKEQILHFVFPNMSFAEGALFDDERYPATAQAVEDSQLLFLPKDDFFIILKNNHRLAFNLFSLLSHRLRFMARKVEELSLLNATSRVCRHLITLWDEESNLIAFPVTRKQTAQSLGIVFETFSRIKKKLKDQGVIRDVSPDVLEVLDPTALKEYAG